MAPATSGLRVRANSTLGFSKICMEVLAGATRSRMAVILGIIVLCVVFSQSGNQNGGSSFRGSSRSKDFPRWSPGLLDIHHLQVGSSVSSFVIMPDGTTMLIDAGDVNVKQALAEWAAMGPPFSNLNLRSPHPNDSKTPAAWIIDYMKDFWPSDADAHPKQKLDYLLLTHLHADHIGDGSPKQTGRPKSASGKYILSGVSELASKFKVKKIIDRGYQVSETQTQHDSMEDATIQNYLQFKEENKDIIFEKFEVGSTEQIKMDIRPEKYDFQVRVIKCNLQVAFPHDPKHPKHDAVAVKTIEGEISSENAHGNENTMSAAIIMEYGDFRYYEGADQEVVRNKQGDIILDTIGPTAKAAGKVDVATLNHHGHGVSEDYIKYIDPSIMVLQGWSSDQPPKKSIEILAASPLEGGAQRKIFATDIFQELLDGMGPSLSTLFQSTSGHIVVRAHPPPKRNSNEPQMFEIAVLDGNRKIKKHYGSFPVRANI